MDLGGLAIKADLVGVFARHRGVALDEVGQLFPRSELLVEREKLLADLHRGRLRGEAALQHAAHVVVLLRSPYRLARRRATRRPQSLSLREDVLEHRGRFHPLPALLVSRAS